MRRGTNIQHGRARRVPMSRDAWIGLGLLAGSILGGILTAALLR